MMARNQGEDPVPEEPNRGTTQHVFLDLDRTLWDFESNSHQELTHLYRHHGLEGHGVEAAEEFIRVYKTVNEDCWRRYTNNEITKAQLREERFARTLHHFGIDDPRLARAVGDDYIRNSPYRTILIPGSVDLLDHLQKRSTLHIITNGFDEVQHTKLDQSGLGKYFDQVITSEIAGAKKPSRKIFEYALRQTEANVDESVMIGDDLATDIEGAATVGMKTIYFNPAGIPHDIAVWKEVKRLEEIKRILP